MNHTLTTPVAGPVAGVAVERSTTKLRPGLLGGIGGLVFAGSGHRAERDPIRLSHERRVDPGRDALLRRPSQRHDRTLGAVPDRTRRHSPRSSAPSSRGSCVEPAARLRSPVRSGRRASSPASRSSRRSMSRSPATSIAAPLNSSVVEGLWVLHNAVFGFLLAAIGIALAGLSTGAAKSGLLSKRWAVAGPVGGVLMVAARDDDPRHPRRQPDLLHRRRRLRRLGRLRHPHRGGAAPQPERLSVSSCTPIDPPQQGAQS